MRLYAGPSRDFVRDSAHNHIAEKLRVSFHTYYGYDPPESEYRSWRDSLRALAHVFTEANLRDHGVILEYELPLTSRRLDCLITGHDGEERSSAVIVELKQWDRSELTMGDDLVRTFVGGTYRDVLHPCAQANQYRRYLADMHEAFHGDEAVRLTACAYLHNYLPEADDAILARRFDDIRGIAPLYTADAVPGLIAFLGQRLELGNGMPVLDRIERSRFRPSKRLLDHVSGVIKREPRFVLLDEQQVVFSRVLAQVRAGLDRNRKHVFLIHGGPGTGKSVLAINLMSEIAALGLNAQYVTGSQAFTTTLRKIVGSRAGQLFKYTNNYGEAEPGIVDVLICDESHRIREFSTNRFRPARRTSRPQVQELIDASKVSVFFIDDRQVVRPDEVGSSQLIRDVATKSGCILEEHRLLAQFRCQGSDAFVNWVDNTLGLERTATPIWDQEQQSFELRIVESPQMLETLIRERNAEGHSARMVAGFCWRWSKNVRPDGSLAQDVVIGSFRHAWNAPPRIRGLRAGIPPANLWAYDPRGIDQIGCIYTAQGFEFDYVGLIWGEDLVYDLDGGGWCGNPEKSHDNKIRRAEDRFPELVKNTYRTLLTRGLKGCYIYFIDKDTERFVRSRTKALGAGPLPPPVANNAPASPPPVEKSLPFRRLLPHEVQRYTNAVPLVNLKFSASTFTAAGTVDPDEAEWIELPSIFRPQPGLFVAQVVGESMNRRIANGSWCLFRMNPTGTRHGKVVIAHHRTIQDPEYGAYTVKLYRSEKRPAEEGEWKHERIVLSPDSDDPKFQSMEFDANSAGELSVIAELVALL